MREDKKICPDENCHNPNHIHGAYDIKPHTNRFGGNGFMNRRSSYEPWYDDKADYNTNAKSYYDYLARFNGYLRMLEEFVNQIARRDFTVTDTNSIDLSKLGDWIDNNDDCHTYNDIVDIKADVIISKATELFNLLRLGDFTIKNGSKIKNDGVWSPDYGDMIKALQKEVEGIDDRVTENTKNIAINKGNIEKNTQNITNMQNSLQQIIDNLYASGAITNNNNTFEFNAGHNLATGNINVYGATTDKKHFIITHKNDATGDIISGVK